MTDTVCGYQGDRDEALVAFLYDDGGDARERGLFEAHLTTCARCRDELAELRGVRAQLARWAPPEPSFSAMYGNPQSTVNPQSANRNPQWRELPAWAQVAAAVVFLGVSAGVANLNLRYDQNGFSVRTGWMNGAPSVPPAPAESASNAQPSGSTAPWRADLAALERQLETEFRATQASAAATAAQMRQVRATPGMDAAGKEVLRRVRALVDESEKRQQRELALRVAEVVRDVSAQRQADLVKIDRTLGAVQNNLGVEVMKDRQKLNTLLIRTSGRQ